MIWSLASPHHTSRPAVYHVYRSPKQERSTSPRKQKISSPAGFEPTLPKEIDGWRDCFIQFKSIALTTRPKWLDQSKPLIFRLINIRIQGWTARCSGLHYIYYLFQCNDATSTLNTRKLQRIAMIQYIWHYHTMQSVNHLFGFPSKSNVILRLRSTKMPRLTSNPASNSPFTSQPRLDSRRFLRLLLPPRLLLSFSLRRALKVSLNRQGRQSATKSYEGW